MEQELSVFGKKVFFLYPPSVMQDALLENILKLQYEIYLVSEHKKIPALLKKYPESILFINIDEAMKHSEWEEYILNIMKTPELSNIRIGIVTYNDNAELAKRFLIDIGVQCGYIKLKLGVEQSLQILIKTLEANEAKGRRKFIRANCAGKSTGVLNYKAGGNLLTGQIIDISVVGISFMFDMVYPLVPKQVLSGLQLKLKGSIAMADGFIIGSREEKNRTIWVLMFIKPSADLRERIHRFIFQTLQSEIQEQLDSIKV